MTSDDPIMRLSRSIVGETEIREVSRIIEAGFLGMGPETRLFEEELEKYLGGRMRVCCVNTGTAALHLALQACGIGRDCEVIVPSLTFVASYQAISATGAIPVPCDVLPRTGCLDANDARTKISEKTKAIMPVHYSGIIPDLPGVYELAGEFGLRVVEDAAHSFGAEVGGKRIGSAGDIICFSFDGIKNITSGEGGAIVTSDNAVLEQVKDARLLGVMRDTEKRYLRERSWEFDVTHQGYRYHMSDIMAAIGRVQLRRFEGEFKPARRTLAAIYRDRLSDCAGIALFEQELESIVPHIMPVRILNGKRDQVRKMLEDSDIQTGIHYKPNHLLSLYGKGTDRIPVAEMLYEELLTLPLHPGLNANDIEKVCGKIISALE